MLEYSNRQPVGKPLKTHYNTWSAYTVTGDVKFPGQESGPTACVLNDQDPSKLSLIGLHNLTFFADEGLGVMTAMGIFPPSKEAPLPDGIIRYEKYFSHYPVPGGFWHLSTPSVAYSQVEDTYFFKVNVSGSFRLGTVGPSGIFSNAYVGGFSTFYCAGLTSRGLVPHDTWYQSDWNKY